MYYKSAAKWNCRLRKLCLQLGEKRKNGLCLCWAFCEKRIFHMQLPLGYTLCSLWMKCKQVNTAGGIQWPFGILAAPQNSKDNENAPQRSSLQGKCVFRSTSFLLRIIPFVLQVQFINDFHFVYSFITFRYEPNFAILKWCSFS